MTEALTTLPALVSLSKELQKLAPNNQTIWYRGQSKQWPILSTLDRFGRHELETSLYLNYHNTSRPYREGLSEPKSSWEYLYEMQHYGMPTRLLDFSKNIYVALFFALGTKRRPKDVEDPCIFLANPGHINKLSINMPTPISMLDELGDYLKMIKSDNPQINQNSILGKPICISGAFSNRRIEAQEGVFILKMNDNTPLEEAAELKIIKFPIPKNEIHQLRCLLDLSGIDYHKLFPDLDNLAQHIVEKHSFFPSET